MVYVTSELTKRQRNEQSNERIPSRGVIPFHVPQTFSAHSICQAHPGRLPATCRYRQYNMHIQHSLLRKCVRHKLDGLGYSALCTHGLRMLGKLSDIQEKLDKDHASRLPQDSYPAPLNHAVCKLSVLRNAHLSTHCISEITAQQTCSKIRSKELCGA